MQYIFTNIKTNIRGRDKVCVLLFLNCVTVLHFLVSMVYVCVLSVFLADPEELCGSDGSRVSACALSGPKTHDALLQRAQAAEERARRSEEALARAMEDLHKLRSVTFLYLYVFLEQLVMIMLICLSLVSPVIFFF